PWGSFYLTFGGTAAAPILSVFGLQTSSPCRIDSHSPLVPLLVSILARLETQTDLFVSVASVDAYLCLGLIGKYGQLSQISVSRYTERLAPVLKWMEEHYPNSDIGLGDMAEAAELSGRQLSKLFQHAFSLSPYAYLIQMRLHKAKELLTARS